MGEEEQSPCRWRVLVCCPVSSRNANCGVIPSDRRERRIYVFDFSMHRPLAGARDDTIRFLNEITGQNTRRDDDGLGIIAH